MPKISIIMPIYNAEDYLKNTINSILNQTFRDFELILLDDGSKDRSGEICKFAAARDSRIVYEYHSNRGIAYTRNRGLQIAHGKWIAFCDHDDLFEKELLEDNYKLVCNNHVDFVKFGRVMITEKESIKTKFWSNNQLLIQKKNLDDYYLKLSDGPLLLYVWDGLFSADFIKKNNITFDESMKAGEEDRNFMLDCITYFNNMLIYPHYYYKHFSRNSKSTSRKFNMNRCISVEVSINHEWNVINKCLNKKNIEKIWQVRLLYYLKVYIDNLIKGTDNGLEIDDQVKKLGIFVNKYNILKKICLRGIEKKDIAILILCRLRLYRILLKIIYYRHYALA